MKLLQSLLKEGVIYTPGKDPEVLVKGVGRYKLSSLEKNVKDKLADLASSAERAKDAHSWGQVKWKTTHGAMHEMINTLVVAHKELEGVKESLTESEVDGLKKSAGALLSAVNKFHGDVIAAKGKSHHDFSKVESALYKMASELDKFIGDN